MRRSHGGSEIHLRRGAVFDWISEVFRWERNNYDKVGHFMQGFVPALIAREILLRKEVVSSNGWRNFIVLSICLAFSAFYELIEWWAALLIGEDADAFLGTQGYVWDTQSDMGLALLGRSAVCLSCKRSTTGKSSDWSGDLRTLHAPSMIQETDWDRRYRQEDTPWDKGEPAPGLVDWLKKNQLDPPTRVLVPGADADTTPRPGQRPVSKPRRWICPTGL